MEDWSTIRAMTPAGTAGTRIVGYIRVSTTDQAENGVGLEAQRRDIEAEAERRGWSVVSILEDHASGKTTKKRKALDAAITLLEGGAADALVVTKLDRLSRSLVDFGHLLERSRDNGWGLVVLDMSLDMTTPVGEMTANTLMNFAEFERRMISQRTRDGLAVRRSQGARLGRSSTLDARVVRRMAREREAGRSYSRIARGLNDDGIPTGQGGQQWWPSTVRKVLTRRP